MNSEQPDYLRFVADHVDRREGFYSVISGRSGQPFRLSEAEYALALLFDGTRNVELRRAAAESQLGQTVTTTQLAEFTHDMAEAGLLEAGAQEPLPPPAQLADQLSDRNTANGNAQGYPPAGLDGSLSGPSAQGPLIGAPGSGRGKSSDGLLFKLPLGPFVGIGHALNATVYAAALRWLPWVLAAVFLGGLWVNRIEAGLDFAFLLVPYRLLILSLVSTFLISAFSQIARAAAVQHYTGEKPSFGIDLALGFIPRFSTSTVDAAERADTSGRLGIIFSGLNAGLVLFVLGVFGWFLSRGSANLLSGFLLWFAILSLVGFLLRVNPLARRDGYFLLATWSRVPDLRDQAWLAISGFERPWSDREPPPRKLLLAYLAAIAAYIVAVIVLIVAYPGRWLENLWGGTGVALFLLVMGYAIWQQTQRMRSGRGRIHPYELNVSNPSRVTWLVIALIVMLALFPYTYEPGGRFEVLPIDRADVRALVSGDVREVLVQEGQQMKAGQPVLRLGNEQQRSQVASSEARIKELEADMSLVKAGARNEEIEVAKQRVTTAKIRLKFSKDRAQRLEKAFQRNAVSAQDYQTALGQAQVQREQLTEAERQLDLISGSARDELISSTEAKITAEQARLELAQTQASNTEVRAPIAGKIASKSLMFSRGDYLERGSLVAVIEDSSSLLVRVYMPESTIGEVAVGAEVTAKSWAYPGGGFTGHVTEIAPSVETGEYGKVIRVLADIEDADTRLKPGMTGQAKITADTYPAIIVFSRAMARFLFVEVWSWLP